MSWAAVGAAAIGGVASIGGGLLASNASSGSGSSPTQVPLADLQRIAAGNVRAIRNAAYGKGNKPPPLVPEITRLTDEFLTNVDELVASGSRELNAEEQELLNRIQGYSTTLRGAQDQEDALLQEDLDKITRDLNEASSLLDTQDREEFSAALNDFNVRSQAVTDEFDSRASGVVQEGDQEALQTINDFDSKSISLGDTFRGIADEALGKFESFISADNAAATLDSLTKSIFDTNQRLIAEADPRAQELAAIVDNNAAAMMSGQISADVQANVARSSAMRALQGGFGASSQMGRGLTARDLGLTSMELMQQGTKMYDDQRRLNYDTRVAGLGTQALGLFGEMRSGQDSLMRASIDTAASDRDQRQSAFKTTLDSNLGRIGDRVRGDLGIASNVLQSQLDTNRLGFDARRDNISERTARNSNRLTNIWDRNFQSRQTVYGENLNTERSIASTNANVANSIFGTKANAIYQDTAARINARDKVLGTAVGVRTGVFDAMNAARTSGAATMADATMANWANNNAWKASQVTTNQNLVGSAINSGMTVFGNLASSVINRQASNPYGFNNFDYGAGTGA
jgi:hypothetical protein